MLFCPFRTYCRIGQCIGRRKSRNLKQTFSWQIKRKVPDFTRNQELFGGDYWTRTSDLLRVKIRLDIKCLLLGTFRYFWLRFFRIGKRSLSTVSTRWYPHIGQCIGQNPGPAHWAGPGTLSVSGGLVSVMVACNRENVKCCLQARQLAMYGPYHTPWWGNISTKRIIIKETFFQELFCIFRDTHHHRTSRNGLVAI